MISKMVNVTDASLDRKASFLTHAHGSFDLEITGVLAMSIHTATLPDPSGWESRLYAFTAMVVTVRPTTERPHAKDVSM